MNRSIFEILREYPDTAADDALLTALRTADPVTAASIVETLLWRRQRAGLRGLVMLLHLLPPPLFTRLLESADQLFTALRDVASSREEQARLNVLRFVEAGRLFRASYLLANMFHDRSQAVRTAAAETLCQLAGLIMSHPISQDSHAFETSASDPVGDLLIQEVVRYGEDRRQLVGAVEAGLATFDLHRQVRVVEVAMWFVDDLGSRFWSLASIPAGRVGHAVSCVYEETPYVQRLIPFTYSALSFGQFRAQVAARLGACQDAGYLSALLEEGWRLVQPRAARAISAVKQWGFVENGGRDFLCISSSAQRLLPRFVLASGLSSEAKADVLRRMLRYGEEEGRIAAAWALVEWPDPAATDLLVKALAHPDPRIARMARLELARRRPQEYPLDVIEPAESSPSGAKNPPEPDWDAARPAAPALSPDSRESGRPRTPSHERMTFEEYWLNFDHMSPAEQRAFGQQVQRSTAGLHLLLQSYLTGSDARSRVRALRMVAAMGMVEVFAEHVYRLSHDPHPEVRSTATGLLGHLPGPVSDRILHKAINDTDPRVQANAVEALDHNPSPSAVPDLLPKLSSPDNRVRANAVKALLKLGIRDAAETLLRMLSDRDRAMRISALWLIERMGLFVLTTRVMSLAVGDTDPQVRQRAQALLDSLRLSSTAPAGHREAGRGYPCVEVRS